LKMIDEIIEEDKLNDSPYNEDGNVMLFVEELKSTIQKETKE